ncbi:MAG TPA: hypothetical protein VE465_02250 [Streptosporangiaceae bacterium]|jgi:hypothetical protein|nr:hypothetical protein [Streptosporangiaceae bacterium]
MKRRPKDIGTAGETATVRHLHTNGFPHAERRALRGIQDAGDIAGTPGLCWSVKGGEQAKNASDQQVTQWLAELEKQRQRARADIGVLVLQRRGVGPANAGRWWVVLPLDVAAYLSSPYDGGIEHTGPPVRMLLGDLVRHLRLAGYGDPLDEPSRLFASETQASATRCDDTDTSREVTAQ